MVVCRPKSPSPFSITAGCGRSGVGAVSPVGGAEANSPGGEASALGEDAVSKGRVWAGQIMSIKEATFN